MNMKLASSVLALALVSSFASAQQNKKMMVDKPMQEKVTQIHLDQYNGYFSAKETFAGLKAGKYQITVVNKSGKNVGFQAQDLGDRKNLAMFPLAPGESKTINIDVDNDGFRYRCPLNPTPWYDVEVAK